MPLIPHLDTEALQRLRSIVKQLHEENGQPVSPDRVARLATEVHTEAGLTIDFQAADEMGGPMVVVRLPQETQPSPVLKSLSPREREIAGHVAQGLSNKQIAVKLFISLATVKDHMHRILNKTGLPNRAALAVACTT
jgi:DNA-binding NarL/FixJ family response regulator